MKAWRLFLIIGMMAFIPTSSYCQTIAFQGLLQRNDAPLPDGQYLTTFRIYDQNAGGDALWIERQSVATSRGLYQVRLGSVEPLQPDLDFTTPYWISVQLPEEAEMGRLPIQYGPYCFNALNLGGKPAESYQTPVIRQRSSYVESIDVVASDSVGRVVTSIVIVADSASTLVCEGRWPGIDAAGTYIMIGLADQDWNVIDEGDGSTDASSPLQVGIARRPGGCQTFWTFSVAPGTYIVALVGSADRNTTLRHCLLSVTCIPNQPDDQRNLQSIKSPQGDTPRMFNKR